MYLFMEMLEGGELLDAVLEKVGAQITMPSPSSNAPSRVHMHAFTGEQQALLILSSPVVLDCVNPIYHAMGAQRLLLLCRSFVVCVAPRQRRSCSCMPLFPLVPDCFASCLLLAGWLAAAGPLQRGRRALGVPSNHQGDSVPSLQVWWGKQQTDCGAECALLLAGWPAGWAGVERVARLGCRGSRRKD